LGHVRKSELENLAITVVFDGKKGRVRQRTSYLASLKKWLDPTTNENVIIQTSANKETMARHDRQGPDRARYLTTTTMTYEITPQPW